MNQIMIDKTKLDRASLRLKAIAHPMRLQIIGVIGTREASVKEIQEAISCDQAVVSQQLKIMKDKDVLTFRKEGTTVFYSVKYKALLGIIKCLEDCEQC